MMEMVPNDNVGAAIQSTIDDVKTTNAWDITSTLNQGMIEARPASRC